MPENFDPCPKILVLPFACACAFSTRVESRCCKVAARMEGSSDVESDLVGEVFEYLLSGKYCDGVSKERKRTIRKKALKFSVSSRGELFYRQKRKGMAITFCSGLSRKVIKQMSIPV